jgi:alanyl-tRNA synthetase
VVGLGTVLDEKPTLVVACTDAAVAAGLKAGDLVGKLAQIVDGKGGGKPTLAQAGGRDTARLPEAVQALLGLVQAQVN